MVSFFYGGLPNIPSAVLQWNGQVVPCSATMEWLSEVANTHSRSSFKCGGLRSMPSAVLQWNGRVVPYSATMEWLICTPCGCNEVANTHAPLDTVLQ